MPNILTRLFSSSEKRSRLPGPLNDFWYGPADSSIQVTPESAMRATAVYAAVRLLAETVAQLPLQVFEVDADGGKTAARDNPLWALLHDTPNAESTSYEWRRLVMTHLLLRGNSYCEMIPGTAGRVGELIPLDPDGVKPFLVVEDDGRKRIWYEFTDREIQGSPRRLLSSDEVLHIRGLGTNRWIGISPIALHAETIRNTLSTASFGGKLFANGLNPSAIIRTNAQYDEEDFKRFKEQIDQNYAGLGNAKKPLVLQNIEEFKPVSMTPEDSQFIETQKFNVSDIARIFNVPPHKLAELSNATFSNIEEQSLEYVIYSLIPWLSNIEAALRKAVFTVADRRDLVAEFRVDGLLRGDSVKRWTAYKSALSAGAMSINEVRRLENLNPVDNGDEHFVPMNMIPLDQAVDPAVAPPPAPPGAPPDRSSSVQPWMEDLAGRVVRAEARAIGEAAKVSSVAVLERKLNKFFDRHAEYVETTIQAPLDTLGAGDQAHRLAAEHTETRRREVWEVIRNAVSVGDTVAEGIGDYLLTLEGGPLAARWINETV